MGVDPWPRAGTGGGFYIMFAFIFGGISSLFHKWDPVCIDNHVFRLHYRGTVIIFLAAIALITSGQYIGNPIHCMSDSVDSGIMNSYCWLHSTYSVDSRYERGLDRNIDSYKDLCQQGIEGQNYAMKGVGPDSKENAGHTYHRFYQWVGFMFVLQAGMFYFPRLLWKAAEGGVMKLLTSGLTDIGSFMNKSTRRDGVELIAKYFNQKQTKRGTYFLKFFACELLNFANVVGQIFFTDMFLGYQFQEFGRDVLSQIEEPINVRDDPLNRVFPKVAKCTFQKFGPSGSLQKHDALCVLPLNIINEKIYVFLYQITKNVNPLIIKDVFEEIKPKSYRANSEEEAALLKSSAPEM